MAFEKTYWTQIERAVQQHRTAINRIARDYQAPIRKFIEHSGFPPHDAEDLAQEALLIICSPEFLKQADAAKGRFRTLVLLVTKNVMNAERRKRYAKKRRGTARSLDRETVPAILAAPPSEDDAFDHEWWGALLDRALDRLKAEAPTRHRILSLHKIEGNSHAHIAQTLSLSPTDVNNEVRAGKKRMRELLLELVRAYCSSEEEYQEEFSQIRRRLS